MGRQSFSDELEWEVLALAVPWGGEVGEVLSNEQVENVDWEDGVFDLWNIREIGFLQGGVNLLGVIEDGIEDGDFGKLHVLSIGGDKVKKLNFAGGLEIEIGGISTEEGGRSRVSQGQFNGSDIEGLEIEDDLELEVLEDVEVERGLDLWVEVETKGISLETIVSCVKLVVEVSLVGDLELVVVGNIDETVLEKDAARSGLIGVGLNNLVTWSNSCDDGCEKEFFHSVILNIIISCLILLAYISLVYNNFYCPLLLVSFLRTSDD
jgi:hypothetical protein